MLPSTSRRGLDGARRLLGYALSALLVAVALLDAASVAAASAARTGAGFSADGAGRGRLAAAA